MKIAIVIPMYNFPEMTQDCIKYTKENAGIEHDIVVVDDGSIFPFKDDRVAIVRHEENKGFTAAINTGLLWCSDRYDYIMLLNNDTMPEPDFLKLLVDAMEKDKNLGITGSSKIIRKDPMYIEHIAADMIFGYHMYSDADLLSDVVDCVWFGFASVLLRHKMIREIGLLDKRFKNHCSDNDYCFRALMNDWKVALIPKSRVFHFHEVTTRHSKLNTQEDGIKLIDKLRGTGMQKIMDIMPLDYKHQTWGRLSMEVYKK